jgi:hypothetical protein
MARASRLASAFAAMAGITVGITAGRRGAGISVDIAAGHPPLKSNTNSTPPVPVQAGSPHFRGPANPAASKPGSWQPGIPRPTAQHARQPTSDNRLLTTDADDRRRQPTPTTDAA